MQAFTARTTYAASDDSPAEHNLAVTVSRQHRDLQAKAFWFGFPLWLPSDAASVRHCNVLPIEAVLAVIFSSWSAMWFW